MTITLKPGATFHDGKPVTAADVKYSLDRYLRLKQGVAGQLSGYASTTVTDDTHLTIVLSGPNAGFLSALSKAYIMEAATVQANAGTDDGQAWLQTNDAGSGPYVETGMPVSGDITIKRYDKYWGFDAKRPTSFTFRRIDQGTTQLAELKAGNVDVALNLAAKDASTLGDGLRRRLPRALGADVHRRQHAHRPDHRRERPQGVAAGLRLPGGASQDPRRQGLGGQRHPAPGPRRAGSKGPRRTRTWTRPRSSCSSQASTGLTLTLRYQPTNAVQTQEATLFQSNLADIGVTLNLEPIAFADYLTLLSDPNTIPQLMLLNDQAQVPDAGTVLSKTYGSKATGTNKSGYNNPDVDALLTRPRPREMPANAATSTSRRRRRSRPTPSPSTSRRWSTRWGTGRTSPAWS